MIDKPNNEQFDKDIDKPNNEQFDKDIEQLDKDIERLDREIEQRFKEIATYKANKEELAKSIMQTIKEFEEGRMILSPPLKELKIEDFEV